MRSTVLVFRALDWTSTAPYRTVGPTSFHGAVRNKRKPDTPRGTCLSSARRPSAERVMSWSATSTHKASGTGSRTRQDKTATDASTPSGFGRVRRRGRHAIVSAAPQSSSVGSSIRCETSTSDPGVRGPLQRHTVVRGPSSRDGEDDSWMSSPSNGSAGVVSSSKTVCPDASVVRRAVPSCENVWLRQLSLAAEKSIEYRDPGWSGEARWSSPDAGAVSPSELIGGDARSGCTGPALHAASSIAPQDHAERLPEPRGRMTRW